MADHCVQATQAGHCVEATQAGHCVEATQAGHGAQATATQAGRATTHGRTTARRFGAGRPSGHRVGFLGATLGLALVLFLVGGLSLLSPGSRPAPDPALGPALVSDGTMASRIAGLQARLRRVPGDHDAWASLGLAYVEQARISVDPAYYSKAEGALTRSLSIESTDNFAACAGMAALTSARHDFAAARGWAQRGLAINPANATLHGALGDAETQLGDYPDAFEAIQRMVDLMPDTASLARASYAWELRGNLDEAKTLMQRALDDAPAPADRAFAQFYLGELAFNAGDPTSALDHYGRALKADPTSAPALAGRAKAEAALGQIDAAIADYTQVVDRVPQPAYLVELGELFQSLGRPDEAAQQYGLFADVGKLLESNGVALDVDPVLFNADHGDRRLALQYAEAGIRTRPFIEMDDAYAWALHVNGRDAEALGWSDKALALGTRNALFHFHAGIIRQSLGDVGGARAHLSEALGINPYFSPLWAPAARQALDALGGQS